MLLDSAAKLNAGAAAVEAHGLIGSVACVTQVATQRLDISTKKSRDPSALLHPFAHLPSPNECSRPQFPLHGVKHLQKWELAADRHLMGSCLARLPVGAHDLADRLRQLLALLRSHATFFHVTRSVRLTPSRALASDGAQMALAPRFFSACDTRVGDF